MEQGGTDAAGTHSFINISRASCLLRGRPGPAHRPQRAGLSPLGTCPLTGRHQRQQRQPPPGSPQYRRSARSPGPGASSSPGSRLSLPGAGRARRRCWAPAAPGASARGPPACTGPRSRSRGSTAPRCKGELQNSTVAWHAHLGAPAASTCPRPRQRPRLAHAARALTAPRSGRIKSQRGSVDTDSTHHLDGELITCTSLGGVADRQLLWDPDGESEPGTHPS